MATTSTHLPHAPATDDRAPDQRLDEIGWGLFLLLTGVLWLLPDRYVPAGAWLIGIGTLLLALNAVRIARGMPARVFSATAGAIALIAGVAELVQLRLPVFGIALVAFGALVVLGPWLRHRRVGPDA